jgi:hypothetical protein
MTGDLLVVYEIAAIPALKFCLRNPIMLLSSVLLEVSGRYFDPGNARSF